MRGPIPLHRDQWVASGTVSTTVRWSGLTERTARNDDRLAARGLTTAEVAAHFADVYSAKVSRHTISKITDKIIGEMAEWASRAT